MKSDSKIGMRDKVKTYRQFLAASSLRTRVFMKARTTIRRLQSYIGRVSTSREWICFPYYHFVLDDERRNYDRQLTYWARFAQFISLDDAVHALQNPSGIGGRYICVTFDDGFKSCATNALPILVDHRCPAAFFVPTNYIGLDLDKDWDACSQFFVRTTSFRRLPFEFCTWDDCRAMQAAGMTIGSHTCSHVHLAELNPLQLEHELVASKARIERELGTPCHHFCVPWGRPNIDFDPAYHGAEVRQAGYRSLLTTCPGMNFGGDPYFLQRKPFLAGDGTFMVRYFLTRNA